MPLDGGGNAANNNSNAPFDLNITDAEANTLVGTWKNSTSATDFWVIYIMGAFQGHQDADNDPDSESGQGGSSGPNDSVIYLETIRDRAAENAQNQVTLERQIVGHEVGHQFGLGHDNGKIMSASLPVTSSDEKFHDNDVVTIRDASKPGL